MFWESQRTRRTQSNRRTARGPGGAWRASHAMLWGRALTRPRPGSGDAGDAGDTGDTGARLTPLCTTVSPVAPQGRSVLCSPWPWKVWPFGPARSVLRGGLPPLMARLEGFEPPTRGLEGRCSIQLSYRRNRCMCYRSAREAQSIQSSSSSWGKARSQRPREMRKSESCFQPSSVV